MIAIVDYGSGNVRSVQRAVHAALQALARNEEEVQRVSAPELLVTAERVIFPGQGSMNDCMASLESSGLKQALLECVKTKPFLGICVGEQMLFERSEEKSTTGLGVLPGEVVRFHAQRGAVDAEGEPLKVPHMGWNRVRFLRPHPVTKGLAGPQQASVNDSAWFYFVHSYHAEPFNASDRLAEADYGIPFTCAVARDNIVATQFHPEKSAAAGLQLLQQFLQWKP
ncbi:MAG: imidazole glycerol phosphate synthase subunit HisH [Burkholderiaceae bacterium]